MKSTHNQIIIFLIPIFIFFNLQAGIKVVGNGGGLGEMIAVSAFEKMERYLILCLYQANPCSLSSVENGVLQNVKKNLKLERSSYYLEFFSIPGVMIPVQTDKKVGSPIKINSLVLADSNGTAYRLNVIGAWVLYGLLLHQNYDHLELAQKVFQHVIESRKTIIVNDFPLHWLKIQRQNQNEYDELILEERESSIPLNSLLNSVNLCAEERSLYLRIQNISRDNPFSNELLIDTYWSCDDKKNGKAKIQLKLKFDNQNRLDLKQSQAIAFGIIRP